MQGNKEHDPIIGERIGTLTSADRIYPIDDWVGWHLQIHDLVFQCIGISKLQETQMFKRDLYPVLEINLGPPTTKSKHPKSHAIEF